MTVPRQPGTARIAFRRNGPSTVLGTAFATSPLRLLTPRNHGHGAWVFLAGLGGGMVGGDSYDIRVDVAERATGLLATQATTKVYRSEGRGCSQTISASVARGGLLVLLPDPVVCFGGARYRQQTNVDLAADGALVVFDGYTCGRAARGERWAFDSYVSRLEVVRDGRPVLIDAVRLADDEMRISDRMGRFDVIFTLFAFGAPFRAVRDAMFASVPALSRVGPVLASASPIGPDGAVLRVAATGFEIGTRVFRPSFSAIAGVLGDDLSARKW
jgi:urease accessory protein